MKLGALTDKIKGGINWGMDLYTKVQSLAFKIPFVRVDAKDYLTNKLGSLCTPEELELAIKGNPVEVIGKDTIHKIARKAIWKHALATATISFILAIPCNFYIEMGLLIIDVVQFQLVVFIIAQKLMYLYGKKMDKKDGDQCNAVPTLLVVSAIMIGGNRITHTLKSVTGSAARKIVLQASTRAGNRILAINFIRQTFKWCGIEVTKNTVVLSFTIIIDFLCCLISGLISFWLIYPMCNRLVKHFEEET